MPDVTTQVESTTPVDASYVVPDYFEPTATSPKYIPTPYAESGFLKVLGEYRDAQQSRGAYLRDTTMTTLFMDLDRWSQGSDQTSPDFRSLSAAIDSRLLPEEQEELKAFLRTNATILEDLGLQIDSTLSDIALQRLTPSERREYVLEQAKFNQRLATAFFHSARLPVDNPERQRIEAFVSFMRALDRNVDVNRLNPYRDILNSALTQAAQMNWFDSLGCYIIVPDYEDDAEMKATDLKGVDFVAVTPNGTLILIDAKGRIIDDQTKEYIEEPRFERDPGDVERDHPARELALSHLAEIADGEVLRTYPGIDKAVTRRSLYAPRYRVITPTHRSVLHVGTFSDDYTSHYSSSVKKKFQI